MRDPHNPYRPYTQRSADHDAEYSRNHQRRQQENWDFVNRYAPIKSGGGHGGVSSGAGGGLGGIIIGLGALAGIGWLIERTGDPYVAFGILGAGVLALAATLRAGRWFFDTAVGQFVATVLRTIFVAGLGAGLLWVIHNVYGLQGLYWAGVIAIGVLATALLLKAIGAFVSTRIGRVVLWLGFLGTCAYWLL